MEEGQGAALEVLAGDVFESLPAGPQVHAVAYLGVAGHGADAGILEVRNELADGVGGNDGIGVDAHVDLFFEPFQRIVEGRGLAAVGLGEDLNLTGGNLRGVGLAGYLDGVVRRAVVNDDDVEVLVVGVEHRSDGTDDDRLFVVGGHQDRDAGIVARRGLSIGLAQAVDDGQAANQQQTRAHQNIADKKDHDNELGDESHAGESDGIGQGAQALPEVEPGHDFGGGFAHEG